MVAINMPASRTITTLVVLAALALSGCTSFPEEKPLPLTTIDDRPVITADPETGLHSTEISVLILNVEGLPWPARIGRGRMLRIIGSELGEMERQGVDPDIVLLQEAFTTSSEPIATLGGYPNVVGGPKRGDRAGKYSEDAPADFIAGRSFWKGEKLGKWLNSGLAVLSDFPIVDVESAPFQRYECAGFDCLANKGYMLATIEVPGVPEPIEIFNTHMNSNRASGVPVERARTAHNLQADDVRDFLRSELIESGRALIVGGDFNTKGDRERLNYLQKGPFTPIVRFYCTQVVDDCQIKTSFDGDEPWRDTQDLQAFYSGERIGVRPVEIDAVFDEPYEGRRLSDHDGYLVVYRLAWDPADFD